MKCQNRDTGSLNLGNVAASVGDQIVIAGEAKARTITYLMGSVARSNLHAVCKGSGPMPTGEIEFEIVPAGTEIQPKPATPSIENMSIEELETLLATLQARKEQANGAMHQ